MLSLLGRKQEAVVALREAIGMNAELRELALRDADLAPLRKDESYAQELSALGLTTAAKPAKNADESFVQAASESDADSNDNAAGP
jgi:hypothetical protein